MILALYILIVLIAVGAVLYLLHRRNPSPMLPEPSADDAAAPDSAAAEEEECCGMHITCERDSLLASVSPDIEYYDDEELDAYRGTPAEGYSEAATEQFRDVLLTLLPADIAGWARSLQLRGIELPTAVREELLMIVAEARRNPTQHS